VILQKDNKPTGQKVGFPCGFYGRLTMRAAESKKPLHANWKWMRLNYELQAVAADFPND
jgi:hypothetical protein